MGIILLLMDTFKMIVKKVYIKNKKPPFCVFLCLFSLQGFLEPFEELFCQTWAFCGFRTQWFSSGNIKILLYHAVVQLESLVLAL
jgi:hypothetical protein